MDGEKSVKEPQVDTTKKGQRFGYRHIQITLLFILMIILFSIKTCLSVAIVAMTTSDPPTSNNPDIPIYTDWDNNSVVLSSLLWGFVVFQAYAGYLAKTYGPKWILFTSILIAGIGSALTPLCADKFGSIGVIVCRVGQGLALGFVVPSTHGILSNWSPLNERSRLGTITYAGTNIGAMFGTLVTGYLSASWIGWPSSFYLLTGICWLWCIVWALFGSNSPEEHPKISYEEKIYIMSSLGQEEHSENIKTPWKAILSSVCFWALVVASIGNVWIVTTFVTEAPTYMSEVLNLSVPDLSIVTTINNGVTLVVSYISAMIADAIIDRGILSIISVRRIFHTIGNVLPAACFIFLGYIPADQKVLCVVLIALILAVQSITANSVTVNHMDLSPRFSGVLMGLANMGAQAVAIFAPLMVQFLVPDETDPSQWRTVFLIAAGITVATTLFFVVFASGERQWWDEGPKKDIKNVEEKKDNKEKC